jgi:CHAT domain-containing protein/Flp pilus assembly protein TadD
LKKILFIILFFSHLMAEAQSIDSMAMVQIDSLILICRDHTAKREFEQALQVLDDGEKMALDIFGKESVAYGNICQNRGRTLEVKGSPDAVKWYTEAKTIREVVLGKLHPDYVTSVNALGSILSDKRQFEEANKYLQEAKAICEAVIGKEDPLYTKIMTNVAIMYMDQGIYDKVEPIYKEIIDIQAKRVGRSHPDYSKSINNLGVFLYRQGRFEEAEPFFIESVEIEEKLVGKEHPDYARSLHNLASLYQIRGKYELAENSFLASKAIREKVLGKEHADYTQSLNNLASLYYTIGKFELSETYYLELKSIREKVLGKDHVNYGRCIVNLASLYNTLGQYIKAEQLYHDAKEIFVIKLGNQHPEYAMCLYSLGSLNFEMGNYVKAEPLLLEAMMIREKTLGKEHPEYAASLISMANLNLKIGQSETAEKNIIEANAIRLKVFGEEHASYASGVKLLGSFYWFLGKFDKAEPLLLQSLTILEKTLGKQHVQYSDGLNSLAVLYVTMGNYEKAERIYLQSLQIKEGSIGKEHPDYAKVIQNLAELNKILGEYTKAESFFEQALVIYEKSNGKTNIDYVGCLNDLAELYRSMGNYEKAEPLYLESKSIWESSLGMEHRDYAALLNNLASLYMDMGSYEKVEPLYFAAKDIWLNTLGKDHSEYSKVLNNLANLYENTGRFSESDSLLFELATSDQNRLSKATLFMSETELGKLVATLQARSNRLNAYVLARPSLKQTQETSLLPSLIYDHTLFYKGFLLSAAIKRTNLISANPESQEIVRRLKGYQRRLSEEYIKPIAERDNMDELEEKANTAEKELAQTMAYYAEASTQVHWQEVLSQLKKDEVAIEFIHFNLIYPAKTDSVVYCAVLLKPGVEKPYYIPLFEEDDLARILYTNKSRKNEVVNSLYTWNERDTINQIESGRSLVKLGQKKKSLYELLWKKIEDYDLDNVNTIYYAPSGILHRINMGAIAINEDQRLSDRYQLVAVNSSRQIVTGLTDSAYTFGSNAIVYGGIQFEADTTVITPMAESAYPLLVTRSLATIVHDSTLRGGTWQYLHWTQKEAEVISSTLSKGGLKAEHRSGLEASEEGFKTMGQLKKPSPRVLHIATHGFFFPDPAQKSATTLDDQSVFKWSDNPMIRSGLILSGGNYAWQNGKSVSPEKEDGILTAYEISQMNLSKTELVVLSACETGLGDIEGNEGVYGLQRAFKIAGAKYLIMSLWQVPDRETMEFMTTFYKNWLPSDAEALAGKEGKMSIPDAFRKTQKEMREKYDDVYSWGAFVLVE